MNEEQEGEYEKEDRRDLYGTSYWKEYAADSHILLESTYFNLVVLVVHR